MRFEEAVETVGRIIDAAAIVAVLLGVLLATFGFLTRSRGSGMEAYRFYRRGLGRAILVGLELLVAADIIRTVVISPTLESLAVLAGIVLIRTFLSFTLELEIEGRWPWQRQDESRRPPG